MKTLARCGEENYLYSHSVYMLFPPLTNFFFFCFTHLDLLELFILLAEKLVYITPQCSCLENPRDGRALWAAVYGVAQSRT